MVMKYGQQSVPNGRSIVAAAVDDSLGGAGVVDESIDTPERYGHPMSHGVGHLLVGVAAHDETKATDTDETRRP